MAEIHEIIAELATIQGAITGVKHAFAEAPESLGDVPAFLNFPSGGVPTRIVSGRQIVHTIRMQLFVTRNVLPQAEKELRPYLKLTMDAFDHNLRLNGKASTSMITRYTYGRLEYAKVEYLGISFDIDVKTLEPFDFS